MICGVMEGIAMGLGSLEWTCIGLKRLHANVWAMEVYRSL